MRKNLQLLTYSVLCDYLSVLVWQNDGCSFRNEIELEFDSNSFFFK